MNKQSRTTMLIVHHDGKVEINPKDPPNNERQIIRIYDGVERYFELTGHAVARCSDDTQPNAIVYVEWPIVFLWEEVLRARRCLEMLPKIPPEAQASLDAFAADPRHPRWG